jgi:hypothetical protein
MEERFAQLEAQLQAVAQQNVTLQARLAAVAATPPPPLDVAALAAGITAAQTTSGHGSDNRLVGKPSNYDGNEDRWEEWSTTFQAYVTSIFPGARALFKKAELGVDDVSLLVLSPRSENMAEQLYRYLLMTCTGVAQKRVTAVGEGEGFEAWKALATHHDPRSRPHRTALMAEILGFSFAGDLTTKIVEFDDNV